ncbi:NADPH-dependent assimilatory sulfite reductase hemoprotein subunit [Blastopirellula sp. JC732]|uniref:NADPH-dependent assimilatory sulfite reductase hemoprotein subunit n=1 Tax=Blastopirellula sediminis TaxID=2894196 RepID=A0A9X1SLG4_9BACT|nr:NADPH-dependent assimilatory sulfite reductase hemoprotein subunit [Blastopirellula sediminis]MCC9606012.1 NADPH-dependent assimilatory sulfite reductase hemoprotein subunit [Blastopirellula sediminis]MCC9630689.1 NADPH-dependent assimilatory sulfite reductase hemoprotein subunit [Blastopirellula sediminis]
MSTDQALSPVDEFKRDSNYLRGEIAQEFVDGTDHFGKSSIQLMKHFGIYQQDDRDARSSNRAAGGGKSYMFMIRTRIPGGVLTSEQMLVELDLCDKVGNETLRITSRQALQHHGVMKESLQTLAQQLRQVGLSTLGACGDVNRNVMCCPAPLYGDSVRTEMQQTASRLAEHLEPKSGAYREIFLQDPETGEKEKIASGEVIEPLYGKQYLPRKFKMGMALPEDNCVDVYTQDLGMICVHENGKILGYNILVGGGQGRTPSAEKTFPALGQRMTFVTPDQLIPVIEAVIKVQRDFGNREDRKVARMKYLIHNWGLEKFKAKVEEYYGASLPEPHPADIHGFDDHKGWHEQGDGKWFYGLNVENGRIKDDETIQLKTAIRKICNQFNPGIRLTSHQDIMFCDIAEADKQAIIDILKEHKVPLTEEISNVRRWSIACVAWPTCGLSITESERALPGIIDGLEVELAKLGLDSEKFTVRMTGCPNGCARPYNSDVGLVGRAKEKYTMFLGGRLLGNRLSFIYKDMVPADEVVAELTKVFAFYKAAREEGESFGDFCHRQGKESIEAAVSE